MVSSTDKGKCFFLFEWRNGYCMNCFCHVSFLWASSRMIFFEVAVIHALHDLKTPVLNHFLKILWNLWSSFVYDSFHRRIVCYNSPLPYFLLSQICFIQTSTGKAVWCISCSLLYSQIIYFTGTIAQQHLVQQRNF